MPAPEATDSGRTSAVDLCVVDRSGRPDSNRGPQAPKACALTRLRYAPCLSAPSVRQSAEQALEDSLEGVLAVRVRAVVHRQDRDRHAYAAPCEQDHLVIEEARAVTPAALEVELPAFGRDLADAPALRGHDPGEQRHRVRTVTGDDVTVDVQEELRLIAGGDLGLAPDRRGREVGHADPVRECPERPLTDGVEYQLGVVVV